MSFLSLKFFAFSAVSLLFYILIPRSLRLYFILTVSFGFAALSGFLGLVLLIGSTILFFKLAIGLEDADESVKLKYLWAGILSQTAVLCFFKFLEAVPEKPQILAGLVMPLGLSYYSFKLIGYLIQVYLGKVKAERKFHLLANYSSFFPQLVSGPIHPTDDFLAQTRAMPESRPDLVVGGMRLILCGLFKKLVVANVLVHHVDALFERSPRYGGPAGLLSTYFIPWQIYADFSGLTDMAVGLGMLFGYRSPGNFVQPFYAPNIQEFWRRWHITLTAWIRDYVFMPLQIRIRDLGSLGTPVSLFVTMLLVGLWHGFTWNWAAFGLLHGFYMSASALTLPIRDKFFSNSAPLKSLRAFWGPCLTFHMVLVSFILFRARTPGDLAYVLSNAKASVVFLLRDVRSWKQISYLFFQQGFYLNPVEFFRIAFSIIAMEAIHLLQNRAELKNAFLSAPAALRWGLYALTALAVILLGNYDSPRFIYSGF